MTAPDLKTAEVVLGGRTVRIGQYRFKYLRQALPLANRILPNIARDKPTEDDFDAIAQMLLWAATETDPSFTREVLDELPVHPAEIGAAYATLHALNGWSKAEEGADPNAGQATGGTGTTSTPT